jgi:hypothetical protein
MEKVLAYFDGREFTYESFCANVSRKDGLICKLLKPKSAQHEYQMQKRLHMMDDTLAPKVVAREYVDGKMFMHMECIEGWSLHEAASQLIEDDQFELLDKLLGMVLERILYLNETLGFVHGDLNPGNIFINKTENCITFIDFEYACELSTMQPALHVNCFQCHKNTMLFSDLLYFLLACAYYIDYIPKFILRLVKDKWFSITLFHEPCCMIQTETMLYNKSQCLAIIGNIVERVGLEIAFKKMAENNTEFIQKVVYSSDSAWIVERSSFPARHKNFKYIEERQNEIKSKYPNHDTCGNFCQCPLLTTTLFD